jgi:hypothetical protein
MRGRQKRFRWNGTTLEKTNLSFVYQASTRQDLHFTEEFLLITRQVTRQNASGEPSGSKGGV